MINIGICFGGRSVEHDISIITFFQIYNAIDQKKYNVIPLYMDKNNVFRWIKKKLKIEDFRKERKSKIINFIRKEDGVYVKKNKLEVVILALHGKALENGIVSSFFETLGIATTSPGIYTSSVFHNKYLTKLILRDNKINTLKFEYINKSTWENDEEIIVNKYLDKKVIVKPVNLGSSIGIKKCVNTLELKDGLNLAFKYDDGVIIEECIEEFHELNQAAYKNIQSKEGIIVSRIEEVINPTNFYGFNEKYESDEITRVLPAKISSNLRTKISKTTKKIMEIFNDIGVMRIDYLVDKYGHIYVNEVNVIPGALSYYLFEAKDIYFSKLIDDLIIASVHKNESEKGLIRYFKSNVLWTNKNNKK